MIEKDNSIVSILKREPEQSMLLLKVGLAGPLLIVAVNWLAGWLLSPLLAIPFTLLLILVFAGLFGFLIARLVRTADRWEVDSAMQARRLLTGNRRLNGAPADAPESDGLPAAAMAALSSADGRPMRPPPPDVDFHRAYFLMQVEQEVHAARREGRHMGVIAIDVSVPHQEMTASVREKLCFDLASMASTQSKNIGQAVSIGDSEFVFSLPFTDAAAAKSFVSKLISGLGNYWCHYGLVIYPEEGSNAQALFDNARARCDDSRNDKGSGRNRIAVAS